MQALWTRLAATAALALSAALVNAAELPDFTQLVEKNGAAVVNVQARHTGQEPPDRSADNNGEDSDDSDDQQQQVPEIFRRFFGQPGVPGGPGGPRGFDPARTSLGSGFIISGDGYILTNNHVVDGADQVSVRLNDRRELDAKVIGTDAQYDIALLKVDASSLPSVAIGDSNKLKPGQWVLAIGSPFGFDHSVTSGIVSAVSRTFGGRDQQYVPFIQTDVAINRGNSGGPLFNMDGQVVGINSQIFSNTGGFMGVSFAIPIDVAMNAVQQIKEKGFVSRGMIGVQIQEVDRERAKALGMPRSGGALVNQITPGSAAEKAGVQLGDVIQSFNGVDIVQSADLPPSDGAARPGSKAEVSVFRDGKTLSLPITVGEAPRDGKPVASTGKAKGDAVVNPLGIAVEELTADQRKQLQLKDEGVLVSRVTGAAKRSTVQPGDVVLMVGRTKVKSPAEFNGAVKDVKAGDSVMLLVRRDQVTSFVAVTVPKDKG